MHAVLNPRQLKVYLVSYFYITSDNRWQAIRFCIDTGSPTTLISETDRVLMGIEYKELEKAPASNFGIGGRVDVYESPNPLTFEFICEDDTYSHTFERLKFIHGRTRQAREAARVLPSLVGMDFIMDCAKLTIAGRQTILETKETTAVTHTNP
jgi:hypothetical protein